MSITTELTALQTNLTNAYDAINTKGGTMPTNKNAANLATAIASIATGGGSSDGGIKFGTISFSSSGLNSIHHELGKRPRIWGLIRINSSSGVLTGLSFGRYELMDVYCFIHPAQDDAASPPVQTLCEFANAAISSTATGTLTNARTKLVSNALAADTLDGTGKISTQTNGTFYRINTEYWAINVVGSAISGTTTGQVLTGKDYLWFVAG